MRHMTYSCNHLISGTKGLLIGALVPVLMLAGCGGGGTSSGGGAYSDAEGVYHGTAIGSGVTPFRSANYTVIIEKNGNVTVDVEGSVAHGRMAGNSFDVNLPLGPVAATWGESCTGELKFHGDVHVPGGLFSAEPVTLNGSLTSSNAVCNGSPTTVSLGFIFSWRT